MWHSAYMTNKPLDLTQSKSCNHCGSVFYRDKRCTWDWWSKAKFCSRQCSARHGGTLWHERIPDLKTAFYRKANIKPENQCWTWSGCSDKDGYPIVTFKGKSIRANRAAIVLSGRIIQDDEYACHTCGNQWCVNPSHIYPGSPKENSADKFLHGTQPLGEKCAAAKLTADKVVEIRKSRMSQQCLAEIYGVTRSNISMIKSRKTWRHVK